MQRPKVGFPNVSLWWLYTKNQICRIFKNCELNDAIETEREGVENIISATVINMQNQSKEQGRQWRQIEKFSATILPITLI